MQKREANIDFRGQFRLTKTSDRKFSDWKVENFNSWVLEFCPTLEITNLFDSEKRSIGCVLGYAITADGVLLRDSTSLSFSIESSTFEDSIEKYISELAGRYVAFISTGTITKMYLDPAGQMAVVYSPKAKLVGSSLYIISDFSDPKISLADLLDIPAKDTYYPFGMTPHPDISRLLPNHFLELTSFTERRHWPKADQLSTRSSNNIESTVTRVSEKLKSNISAVLDQYPAYMSLTAGQDSRMLLAAAKGRWEEIEFFTMRIPDEPAMLDCRVASVIARKFNLKHKILEWRQATDEQLEVWQMRIGNAGAGRTWQAVNTLMQLDPGRVYMQGILGELARGIKWKNRDLSSEEISIEEIVIASRVPAHPLINEAATRWVNNLPLSHPLDILDFVFIEQSAGCKFAPKHYGHINNVRIPPFSDRFIFTQLLELPAEYRFQGQLAQDLVQQYSKELSRIPINEEIGARAVLAWAKRKANSGLFKSRLVVNKTVSAFKTIFR